MSDVQLQKLIDAIERGEQAISDTLFLQVYEELHGVASALIRNERKGHTLQPTALVHEAYFRLIGLQGGEENRFSNVNHFMAAAAQIMRRILINHAAHRRRQKRGGNWTRVPLDDLVDSFDTNAVDLLALDEALKELENLDPVQHKLVEMRYFSGMTMEQCSQVLDISVRSLYLEWAHARSWLQKKLGADIDES